jgi:hypothetical protein
MSKFHNKKRNIGIIYEQIIKFISLKLLENKKDEANNAIKIIKKYFKNGTQLQKEYKLFKALATTNNISDNLATSIIKEAKKACNNHFNNKQLEIEKSNLIKDLNYAFGKGTIFEQEINDYKTYATIQTLLNEWRDIENSDFERKTEFEIKLHENLTKKVEQKQEINIINENIKVDKLTFNLMKKIFDEKYNINLNENQKQLINHFTNNNSNNLISEFKLLKQNSLKNLNNYIKNCDNNFIKSKYQNVINNIHDLNENDISKDNLKKFLTLSKLNNELLEE